MIATLQSRTLSYLLSKNIKTRIYKIIILPVVLYRRETCALPLRKEHGPRVFENRVLRGIFGPKRDEVTGGWTDLHSDELHNLYSSPSIIRMIKSMRIRWAEHVTRMGKMTTGDSSRRAQLLILPGALWPCVRLSF
jgi:hypothetical protein